MRIFMCSGIGSTARKLSAVSSIVVIGKVGWVQNFLNQHNEKLSKASLLGKICVAVSVLPVTYFTFFLYVFNISLVGQLQKYLTFDCFICTAHSENKD